MHPRRPNVEAFRSEANAERVVGADSKTSGFQGVAYSGAAVKRFYGMTAVDLAAMQIKAKVPVVFNHDDVLTVGHCAVANDGKSLSVADGSFSPSTQYGREIATLMEEGHPFEFSIAASGDWISADRKKPVELNGRRMELDSYIGAARLLHVSFVQAGADPDAIAAKLSALYGLEQPPTGVSMSGEQQPTELETLKAKLAAIETENARLKAENETAATAAKTARDDARKARIAALFGENAELADEDRVAFMEMSDAAFAAVEKRDALLKKQSPELFRQTATGGRNEGGDPSKSGAGDSKPKQIDGIPADEARFAMHQKIVKYRAEHPEADYLTAAIAVEQGA